MSCEDVLTTAEMNTCSTLEAFLLWLHFNIDIDEIGKVLTKLPVQDTRDFSLGLMHY